MTTGGDSGPVTTSQMGPLMGRTQVKGMVAAIAAISVFAFGFSLIIPLLAILMEQRGFSGLEIGVVNAASAFAIAFGGFVLPSIVRMISVPLLIMLGATLMAATFMIFLLTPNFYAWMLLRFVMGFAAAALFFASEIWIIASAPEQRRGFMIGIYGLFLSLGFLAGPLLLKTIGTEGWAPFMTGAAVVMITILPVIWAWNAAPDLSETDEERAAAGSPFDVFRFFRTDPAVLWAVALFGCIEFGAMGLIPVWSIKIGQTEQMALTLVALLAAGNVLMQVPMGWLGDQFNRRKLLSLCAGFCVIAALGAPTVSNMQIPLYILTAVWGGVVVGLYTFALNELGSRYTGAEFARGNGAFMTSYGLGALFAPPLLGAAMDVIPPHGMFHVLAMAAAAYLALLLLRRGKS